MTPSNRFPFLPAKWAWPAAILFLAQVLLFAILASRGFEFTDEAFYLLNGLYWRDFTAVYSLFGVFLDLPMRLTGGDLGAMRMLTLLSLTGSGAFLAHRVQRHMAGDGAQRLPALAYWLVGGAGGLYFFGVLGTLRAPSYNTIALSAAAVSTAFLLQSMDAASGRGRAMSAFAYGLVLAICGLCKGSTGVLLTGLHLVYFCVRNRRWRPDVLAQQVGGALCGVAVQLAVFSLVHPAWIAQLQAGTALFSYDTGGKLGTMLNGFRWDIQRLLRWSPLAALGLLAWAGLLRYLRVPAKPRLQSALILLPLGGVVLLWMLPQQVWYWWPAALLLAMALLLVQVSGRSGPLLQPAQRQELALGGLLFSLPFAFSFGTNMTVLEHSQVAAMFVVVLLMVRFEQLWLANKLGPQPLGLAMALLCLPPLAFQVRGLFDAEFTYRLPTAMLQQDQPWSTPVGKVWVDPQTRLALANLQQAAQRSGLASHADILDFTGDGPGLVLALAGKPVGVPWLVGGYPDSATWARRMLGGLPATTLKDAWLLSSPDNPRAIPGWQTLLENRIGPQTHVLAARFVVRAPSSWGKNARPDATLCLWRPAGMAAPAAAAAPDAASCASLLDRPVAGATAGRDPQTPAVFAGNMSSQP